MPTQTQTLRVEMLRMVMLRLDRLVYFLVINFQFIPKQTAEQQLGIGEENQQQLVDVFLFLPFSSDQSPILPVLTDKKVTYNKITKPLNVFKRPICHYYW